MKYTDAEVDAVALAISQAAGTVFCASITQARYPDYWRHQARAALAARDALFEVVGERWEVRDAHGKYVDASTERRDVMRTAERRSTLGYVSRVVHVTTKRRKR